MSLGQRIARLERAVGMTGPCLVCKGRGSTRYIVDSGDQEKSSSQAVLTGARSPMLTGASPKVGNRLRTRYTRTSGDYTTAHRCRSTVDGSTWIKRRIFTCLDAVSRVLFGLVILMGWNSRGDVLLMLEWLVGVAGRMSYGKCWIIDE